jgi:excinuclease ABC subunit B
VSVKDIPATIQKLKKEMKEAATHLEFERAAELRDKIQRLEETELRTR